MDVLTQRPVRGLYSQYSSYSRCALTSPASLALVDTFARKRRFQQRRRPDILGQFSEFDQTAPLTA